MSDRIARRMVLWLRKLFKGTDIFGMIDVLQDEKAFNDMKTIWVNDFVRFVCLGLGTLVMGICLNDVLTAIETPFATGLAIMSAITLVLVVITHLWRKRMGVCPIIYVWWKPIYVVQFLVFDAVCAGLPWFVWMIWNAVVK